MNRGQALRWTIPVWIVYVASWFLPAFRAPDSASPSLEGWKLFVLAGAAVIDPEEVNWFLGLCIVGVLSNFLVALTPWLLRRDPTPLWLPLALKVSFFVNFGWIPAMHKADLLLGYWLWLGSIGALALIAVLRRRGSDTPVAPASGSVA